MNSLQVELGERSYPIYIGEGLFRSKYLTPHIHGRQVCIVTNETIAPLYLQRVVDTLASGDYSVETVILPDGEKHKNLETLNLVFDGLLQARFNRQCTLVALGGGVIGDMAG